jgi:hypothetical protein
MSKNDLSGALAKGKLYPILKRIFAQLFLKRNKGFLWTMFLEENIKN